MHPVNRSLADIYIERIATTAVESIKDIVYIIFLKIREGISFAIDVVCIPIGVYLISSGRPLVCFLGFVAISISLIRNLMYLKVSIDQLRREERRDIRELNRKIGELSDKILLLNAEIYKAKVESKQLYEQMNCRMRTTEERLYPDGTSIRINTIMEKNQAKGEKSSSACAGPDSDISMSGANDCSIQSNVGSIDVLLPALSNSSGAANFKTLEEEVKDGLLYVAKNPISCAFKFVTGI